MLITIQFPLTDSRAFVSDTTYKLVLPSWGALVPDRDFVRSFGAIRRRPQGGLSGWLDESFICEADHALTFQGLKSFKDDAGNIIKFRVLFRRFYFDGLAVAKFEIGLAAWEVQKESCRPIREKKVREEKALAIQARNFILHVLQLPVCVPEPAGKQVRLPLYQAGRALAKLYIASSTSKQVFLQDPSHLKDWWVQSCEPIILINYKDSVETTFANLPRKPFTRRKPAVLQEILQAILQGNLFPFLEENKFSFPIMNGFAALSHQVIPCRGQNIRVWLVGEDWTSAVVRQLRIFLLRLHAERMCLRQVLRNITTGKLLVSQESKESRVLKHYLEQATTRIKKLNKHSDKRAETSVETLAREAEDYMVPGECDALFEVLKRLDIEKNIFKNIEAFVQPSPGGGQTIMGNQYNQFNVNQAGAVGPNAHAHDMILNQAETQIEKSIDLIQLAEDLATLRQAMLKESTDVEHSVAVGDVAKAEQAAKAKDPAKVAEYLKSAGKWSLDIATKIGVPVAVEALKRALGSPV